MGGEHCNAALDEPRLAHVDFTCFSIVNSVRLYSMLVTGNQPGRPIEIIPRLYDTLAFPTITV